MEIQSLSICVPSKGCPNRCPFCVSRQHDERWKAPSDFVYERDLIRRMQFARDNHCNTVVLTGTGEPMLNHDFFSVFGKINCELTTPFQWIELQTSGVTLNDTHLLDHLYDTGVSTISLSVANIFSGEGNADLMEIPAKLRFSLRELCKKIKDRGLNLRLSLNMTDLYNDRSPDEIFGAAQLLGADQLTFRYLFENNGDSKQAQWVKGHRYDPDPEVQKTALYLDPIKRYIVGEGRELETLPFGATRYSVHGISTVIDSDCMSVKADNVIRYLIIRENGKLYTKWDDEGSLLF